ncbi:MAG: hypothetical protein KGJ23_15300 [Euryarchaeota archaeon]|nr:hypothetical protein [Euryarchaeota archaeon]MDE1837966.1 hypothetical protein [Euryarchaeota archaeon]MDE1880156.1 hypothetical protein [Euryarchaeota archaeon]MDE2046404.1 hypothetical protein [Thermoplasmata archaeon]
MRNLTAGEASVVRAMLAALPSSERERIQESGIPPRTFRGIRSRAYEEGWIVDRYLPDPVMVSRPFLTFVLGEPFVERFSAVIESWGADPRVVHFWKGPQYVFVVLATSETNVRVPGVQEVSDVSALRRHSALTVDSRSSGLPVYFDFEGSWGRWAGLTGSLAYPHGWRSSVRSEGDEAAQISPGARSTLAGLVRRPFELEAQGRSAVHAAPFFVPRSQRRAMERGWVQRRVFLDPQKLLQMGGWKVENLAFVQGELLPKSEPLALLHALVDGCRLSPFLFACDGRRLLLGSLAAAGPAPEKPGVPRASVSATLESFLKGIEVFRTPLTGLVTPVNHRYDRMLGAPSRP